MKNLFIAIGTLIILGIVGTGIARIVVVRISPAPDNLGVKEGQLAPCPESPNCVSSQAGDAEHQLDPIPYTLSTQEEKARLMQILASMPRVTLVEDKADYIHFETRSFAFGFIDDNEFYFDQKASVIHVRAAARLGRSDFGMNRKRITSIKETFTQAKR